MGPGLIGAHLVKRLKADGWWCEVLTWGSGRSNEADDFIEGDLRDVDVCNRVFDGYFDEVYQLAADMGGAGFVFTGDNDAEIMHNSATINLNVLEVCRKRNIKRIFIARPPACIPSTIRWIP